MARKTRPMSTASAKGKPAGKPKAKTGKPPKMAPEPLPETVEATVAAIAKVCDLIDAEIPKPNMRKSYEQSAVADLKRNLMPLIDHLTMLLPPEDDVRDFLLVALSTDLGVVPSWSRPGTFLLWFGPIPVRCTWPGVIRDTMLLEPADPAALWWDARPTIERFVSVNQGMDPVRERFRVIMATAFGREARDKKGRLTARLRPLRWDEAAAVEEYRQTHRWLWEPLRKGPVDPVAMPQELLLAQPQLAAGI